MRKTVKIYVPTGRRVTKLGDGDITGYASYQQALKALDRDRDYIQYLYPNGATIEERDFNLPDDAFWTNDLVEVELHRGGHQDEDGIGSGGEWGKAYGLVRVSTISLQTGEVNGYLFEPGTERHIQFMTLRAGVIGFPYRNAVLLRANDVEGWQ